jgi:hypothetical protein
MVKSDGQKGASLIYGGLVCTLIIILASIAIQMRDVSPLNEYISKNISSAKPYATFEEFYPHYLNEHTQETTRKLHYVGTTLSLLYLLTNPILSIPMIAAGLSAYAIIPYSRHLSTGLTEVILFAIIYFPSSKFLTNSFIKPFLPLLLGYSCSWIGHFAFEHNKPAAFIYPTYSFLGDIYMMYDAIKGQF